MIPAKKKDRSVQLDWVADWFRARELVNDEVFSLPLSQAPETLFFDETNV
jgi:hypothetical protein